MKVASSSSSAVTTAFIVATTMTISNMMMLNHGRSGGVVHAKKDTAPPLLQHKHPLLPWTTQLMGGASATTQTEQQGSAVVLGQDEAATTSLEISIPLSQSATLSKNDAPLMQDIHMLTDILSDLVEHENPQVHDLYKEFLEYGQLRYEPNTRPKLNKTKQPICNGTVVSRN